MHDEPMGRREVNGEILQAGRVAARDWRMRRGVSNARGACGAYEAVAHVGVRRDGVAEAGTGSGAVFLLRRLNRSTGGLRD